MNPQQLIVGLALGAVVFTSSDINGETDNHGVTISGTRVDGAPRRPAQAPRSAQGHTPQTPAPQPVSEGPAFEYRAVVECTGGSLDHPDQSQTCYSAARPCIIGQDPAQAPGQQARLYRRTPGAAEWIYVGETCVPGVGNQTAAPAVPAAVTVADVQRAFEETPFAMPIGSTEPVGGATLVNLPTYFALTWSPTGYRPGQTRTLAMLGHTVDLRLVHGGHVYDFGDGTRLGPTPSPGGPYPTGDVTHTYRTAATLTPTATTTITADYRIDGGPWQRLPGQSTQTTAFPALTVFTASNRLRTNPN